MRLLLCLCMGLLLLACQPSANVPDPAASPDAPSPLAARGQALFGRAPANCATCHALEPGVQLVGPSLAGVATRADARVSGLSAQQYLELSIMKPDAYLVDGYPNAMPPTIAKQITNDQLHELVAYLLTLEE